MPILQEAIIFIIDGEFSPDSHWHIRKLSTLKEIVTHCAIEKKGTVSIDHWVVTSRITEFIKPSRKIEYNVLYCFNECYIHPLPPPAFGNECPKADMKK